MVCSEALLTIDLGAIRRNWQRLQDRIGPNCVCAAVAKANAYGLGIERVVPALYEQGCRFFFVATVSEGVRLRRLLAVDATIFVLDGLRPGFESYCLEYQLQPVLFSRAQLQRWQRAQSHLAEPAPCAIKFDSGMGRLGFSQVELQALLDEPELLQAVQPRWFISHLACADDGAHPLNRQQLHAFQLALSQVRQLLPDIKSTLANSSGVFLGQEWHFDLVRPGAALYGVNPEPGKASPVESVVSLRLPVVQIRHVEAGGTVGYGAEHQLQRASRLAVVLGGYADGIHRAVGGSGGAGRGWLCGIEVPVVGRVSMDTTVFDITAVPEDMLPPEGEAYIELLGEHQGVDDVALAAGTIGYEILTSLGDRYERSYKE